MDEVKIVELDTQPAVKSIKELRTEIKACKDAMASMEEGSDEFLAMANKAGTLKHQMDEINESVKGASADFGDMLSNGTSAIRGLIGGFQAAQGALTLFGVESEEVTKAIQKMQASMAVVQGLDAIDKGIKSLDKLRNAITATTTSAKLLKTVMTPTWIVAISASITGLILLIKKWTSGFRELKEQQEEFRQSLSSIENSLSDESQKIKILNTLIRDNGVSIEYRKKALTELKGIVKDYKGDLTDEGKLLNDNVSAIETYCDALEKQIRIKLYSEEVQKLYKQQLDNELEIEKKRVEAEKLKTRVDGTDATQGVTTVQMKLWGIDNEISILENKNKSIAEQIDTIYGKIRTTSEGYVNLTNSESEANKKSAQASKERTAAIEEFINQLTIAQAKRKALYGDDVVDKKLPIKKPALPEEGSFENDTDTSESDKIMQRLNRVKDTYAIIRQTEQEYYAQAQSDLDALYRNETISNEEYTAGCKKLADERAEYEKQKQLQTASYAASGLSALASMLSSFSQMCDTSTQEGFEMQKKLQISSAIMSTLSGIIAAWTSAMSLPAPASFILGAIQTAATASMGAANIANIQKQQFGATSSYTPTISNGALSSVVMPATQYSQAIQGASIEQSIGDNRSYVAVTEIERVRNKVNVAEYESKY